ncbi:CCA tRNA nucleotidyltransferase, mitochondrial [Psilocybe cubensis]|uniref:CCA tRNA nucleotidyltransferase, mitochondrial n=2 Tax=Psilocybe cubensis TaxID=181762 RepID=A0ACB8HG77_PSICU|nr:CCA tRNA nucleotidyltransferase, mitochondrial [Psilocybe cubensis]KAH9486667.1 CCA tRNA nucleotidyltransferase, mitochondrial [Psilocybe cubensis]
MDVALSSMMGLAFAEHLSAFANSKGVKLGTITKIEQNPDQSKHLETATLKIFGLDIDLVNLRSEEYAAGSRIPCGVSFGTPLEDALRRDITINALFYNVETSMVEDFTGKGVDDLRNGIIRTPMPPMETFQDDPLRVLRCIRFASRFGFEVVSDIEEAAKSPIIQKALVEKVARERVGDEVSKMITGRNPLQSANLIHQLALYPSIFCVVPPDAKSSMADVNLMQDYPNVALGSAVILNSLLSLDSALGFRVHPALLSNVKDDSSAKARIMLATLLTPFVGMTFLDKKKKIHPVVASVIRDSLKLGSQNHFLDGIPALFSSLSVIKEHVESHEQNRLGRAKMGLFLRHKFVHNPNIGNHWTSSLLFSLVTRLRPLYDLQNDIFDIEAASRIVTSYNSLLDTVFDFALQQDIDAKPLLNGREVGTAFGVSKPGPWIGKVLEDVVEWQLGHPKSSKSDCLQWLQSRGIQSYISDAGDSEKVQAPTKRLRTK